MRLKTCIFPLIFLCSLSAFSQENYLISSTLLPLDNSRSFVTLNLEKNENACGVINSKGILEGQIPIEGIPLGMGKVGEKNVILFYAEKPKKLSPIKVIHAALIETGKNKILKDKIVYNNPGSKNIEEKILCDAGGNFISLLVRVTDYSPQMGGFGGNEEVKTSKTTSLTNITLDNDLSPKEKEIKSIAFESTFLEACGGSNKNFYICSLSEDQLIAEKYDSTGEIKGKIVTDVSIRRKSTTKQVIQFDSLNANCINIALAYLSDQKDDFVQMFRFDFNTKKAITSENVSLNKDYVRSMKDGRESSKLSHFGNIRNLTPVKLIETSDKIILIKEVQSQIVDKNSVTQKREGGIISVYTKDLKLLMETPIDKWCAFHLLKMPAINGSLQGDNLYIVTAEMKGLASYKTILYTLNINTGAIIDTRKIDNEEPGFNWLAMPNCIMWSNKNFVVPFANVKSFFGTSLKTSMTIVKYQ